MGWRVAWDVWSDPCGVASSALAMARAVACSGQQRKEARVHVQQIRPALHLS